MLPMIRFGLIGPGDWGLNYIKTINKINGITLKKIACRSLNNKRNDLINKDDLTDDWREITQSQDIDGIIISSHPNTHFEIALEAIKNKKPFIIEKPLTLTSYDANYLADLALKNKVNIKVNHIYLYHPMYRFLKKIVEEKVGLNSIYTLSGNYGPFRDNISPLWDWAPHDIAMMLDFIKEMPLEIEAKLVSSKSSFKENKFNVCSKLTFKNNKYAELNFGNVMQEKRRYLKLDFGNVAYVFDPLKYNHIKEDNNLTLKSIKNEEDFESFDFNSTPLENLVNEFADDIRQSRFKMYDIELAKNVILIIELIEKKLKECYV